MGTNTITLNSPQPKEYPNVIVASKGFFFAKEISAEPEKITLSDNGYTVTGPSEALAGLELVVEPLDDRFDELDPEHTFEIYFLDAQGDRVNFSTEQGHTLTVTAPVSLELADRLLSLYFSPDGAALKE